MISNSCNYRAWVGHCDWSIEPDNLLQRDGSTKQNSVSHQGKSQQANSVREQDLNSNVQKLDNCR